MTVKGSIRYWKKFLSEIDKLENIHPDIDWKKQREATAMAIEALEKQIPYKPQEYEDKYYACKCGNVLLMKWEKYPTKLMPKSRGLICCLACSQRIDWSE